MTFAPTSRLSPGDFQIVQLLAGGVTNPDIATVIGKTEQAVKNNLRHVYDTTGMSNTMQRSMTIGVLKPGQAPPQNIAGATGGQVD
jgi:DNA-binding NarL/FixJ family response regulator